jgi:predicted membrane protein
VSQKICRGNKVVIVIVAYYLFFRGFFANIVYLLSAILVSFCSLIKLKVQEFKKEVAGKSEE